MPFYDLRCRDCGDNFNIFAGMTDKAEKRIPCPGCGSFNLETDYKSAPGYIKNTKEPVCPNRHVCGGGCRHAG
ncbi:MAG: zinc ribbon domain-containing protein [Oscillospiraceae bacterium]|nr:zinc ribbon domain-containing protein [Oscillospiraceae bacterium]